MQKMGKASKWIRNFLIGKKEEKNKKKDCTSFSTESFVIPTEILPATPKVKQRWSFGRSAGTHIATHKSTRSFDSIVTTSPVPEASPEDDNGQNHAKAMAVATNDAAKTATATIGTVEDAAAAKIQAFFRSYLARKALCALRGLVKLQALVRGHLVRKQTTAMVQCMNALMAIQYRARAQRTQMVKEPQLVVKKRTIYKELGQNNQLSRAYRETMDVKIVETRGGLKSRKGHINHPQTERMDNGCRSYYSGRLSISKREHQFQFFPNSSPLTDASSRISDRTFEDSAFNTSQRNSQQASKHNTKMPFTIPLAEYEDTPSRDYQFVPSYMANTESSRAKVRSQSEPKQRPIKPKSRRTPSVEGMTVTPENYMQQSSSHVRDNAQKNKQPWLVKLYRSTQSIKDIDCDSTSTTNDSSYCKTLAAYEPAVNLY